MSLDVYLNVNTLVTCENCGFTVDLINVLQDTDTNLFWQNITHNLDIMARHAGIYDCVWRPEQNGIKYARQLIAPLEDGIQKLKSDPAHYRQYDAPNGWGTYEQFVPWLENYLQACKKHPNALVRVSR